MKFDHRMVQNYLELIEDSNPVHDEIVPGQLVCEWLLHNVVWNSFKIKYKQPISINEKLYKEEQETLIRCSNSEGVTKIEIIKC
ncbi:hypothetical protein [Mammaliicoccus lentus]|uniref:hypothetical protein n=1 Tax=Mammaliicoccus lentus TaxID=42858 RepID=UPI001072CA6D|nr:hypothetical protein [Mammaliicoccus lentus]MBF0749001.1 hypothetical protein [Mammaliicoccus lentus]TFU58269.1 hypothetical protein E4T93_06250 [Mammaliicoccus lentus]